MGKLHEFVGKVVDQLINPLILLMAGAAFVVFIWGLFEFIVHAGEENKREEERKAIFWGLIGLVIIFGVYGILNVVTGTFGLDPIEKTLTPK